MYDYEDELRGLLKKVFASNSINEFDGVEKDIKKIITSEVNNIIVKRSVNAVGFNASDNPLVNMLEDFNNDDNGKKFDHVFDIDAMYMYQNNMELITPLIEPNFIKHVDLLPGINVINTPGHLGPHFTSAIDGSMIIPHRFKSSSYRLNDLTGVSFLNDVEIKDHKFQGANIHFSKILDKENKRKKGNR